MSENNAFKITYGEASATFSEGDPDIVLNTNGKHLDSNIQIEQGNATDYGIYFGDSVGTISAEATGREGVTGNITLNMQGTVSDKKIIVKPNFQSAVDTQYLHFSSPNPFYLGHASRRVTYPANVTLYCSDDLTKDNPWTEILSELYQNKKVYKLDLNNGQGKFDAKKGSDNQYHLYLRGSGGSDGDSPCGLSTSPTGLPLISTVASNVDPEISVAGRLSSLINYTFDPNSGTQEPAGLYQYLFNKYSIVNSSGTTVTYTTGHITNASGLLMPNRLVESSCLSMFEGCTYLVTAPADLPANTLQDDCYEDMFKGCSSLTVAPTMSNATTIADYCCSGMFNGCSHLTTPPPILPAALLSEGCYNRMFYNCEQLITIPSLENVNQLGVSCYEQMFYGCKNITTPPTLPILTLANYCYRAMFQGCINLEILPVLPATTMKSACYQNMFNGCTKIKISDAQTGAYQTPYLKTGSTVSYFTNMFANTGGSFTSGTLAKSTTYYTSNQVI